MEYVWVASIIQKDHNYTRHDNWEVTILHGHVFELQPSRFCRLGGHIFDNKSVQQLLYPLLSCSRNLWTLSDPRLQLSICLHSSSHLVAFWTWRSLTKHLHWLIVLSTQCFTTGSNPELNPRSLIERSYSFDKPERQIPKTITYRLIRPQWTWLLGTVVRAQ